MIIFKKDRFKYDDPSNRLVLIRFIFSIGTGAAGVVWSLYMNSLGFSESAIGFIAGFIALFSLLFSISSTVFLEHFGVKRAFVVGLLLYILSYFTVGLFENKIIFIIVSFLIVIATALRVNSFGILFRDTVKRKDLEKKEGLLFTFANFGWFVSPPIAGFILAYLGYNYVFYLSSFAFFIALIIFLILHTSHPKKSFKTLDKNILKNMKEYFLRKELLYPYLVLFGIRFHEAFIFIFLPVFLFKRGLGEEYIGLLFGAFALVHTIFDYKVGRLAIKIGYKKLFLFGFIASSLVYLISSFFNENVTVILFLMIVLSFITLTIEPLYDSFFFSKLKKKKDEEKFFPIFTTAIETGNLFGKFLIASVLIVLPNNFAYIGMAIVMLFIGLTMFGMKK